MATKIAKTWNKGLSKDSERWLKVHERREIEASRRGPIPAEFYVESRDEHGWCDRIEPLDLGQALSWLDAGSYDSAPQLGCIANAWGDAAKGSINR